MAGVQYGNLTESTTSAQIAAGAETDAHAPFALWFYLGEIVVWTFLIVMAIIEFAPISWIFATSLRNPADSFNLPPRLLANGV